MTTTPSAFKIEQVMSVAIAFAARLREQDPDIATDELSFLSALESETDATELLVRILRAGTEADALADAVDARMKDLAIRRDRFKRRHAEARSAAFAIMDALGLAKFQHAEFTASIRAGTPGVVIVDETLVPEVLMTHPAPAPNKTAIKKALQAGEAVPGAEMQNSMPSLIVRTK